VNSVRVPVPPTAPGAARLKRVLTGAEPGPTELLVPLAPRASRWLVEVVERLLRLPRARRASLTVEIDVSPEQSLADIAAPLSAVAARAKDSGLALRLPPAAALPRCLLEPGEALDALYPSAPIPPGDHIRTGACADCARGGCPGLPGRYAAFGGRLRPLPAPPGAPAPPPPSPAPPPHTRGLVPPLEALQSHGDGYATNREVLQLRGGLRTLIKCERGDLAGARQTAADFASLGFLTRVHDHGAPRPIAFVARAPAVLEEAIALQAVIGGEARERRPAVVAMGARLGYPPCCAAAFADTPEQDDHTHVQRLADRHTDPADPLLNWVSPELRLFSHFPCGPSCDASRDLAAATLELLAVVDPAVAAARLALLRSVMLLEQADAYAFLPGATRTGDRVDFDEVWSAIDFPRLLRSSAATAVYASFHHRVVAAVERGAALRLRNGRLVGVDGPAAPDGAPQLLGEPSPPVRVLDFTRASEPDQAAERSTTTPGAAGDYPAR
jgi:hypothetical protein